MPGDAAAFRRWRLPRRYSAYGSCRAVWRHHWSADFAGRPRLRYLPLGYKSGFARPEETAPAAARPHRWGFAGDANKTTRGAMLAAMRQVEPGAEHLISGWEAADSLPVALYREMMDRIVFAPCPRGFASPDSFRCYEALEAGCIPIVERAGNGLTDYYTAALGPHPMLVVSDWAEAPAMLAALAESGGVEALRRACLAWWAGYKNELRRRLAEDVGVGPAQ